MNKNGFILLDALLSVFIVTFIVTITTNVFQSYSLSKRSYDEYAYDIANRYFEIYDELGECEKCVIQEDQEDSSLLEPY